MGQFGRVVAGTARGLAATGAEPVAVAVKMLRAGAGPSERADLLSELSLLQQVRQTRVSAF